MSWFERQTMQRKMQILLGAFAACFVVFALGSYLTVSAASVNGPYYHQIAQAKDLVADVLPPPTYIIESYLVSLEMSQEENRDALKQLSAKSRALRAEYEARHAFWVSQASPPSISARPSVR